MHRHARSARALRARTVLDPADRVRERVDLRRELLRLCPRLVALALAVAVYATLAALVGSVGDVSQVRVILVRRPPVVRRLIVERASQGKSTAPEPADGRVIKCLRGDGWFVNAQKRAVGAFSILRDDLRLRVFVRGSSAVGTRRVVDIRFVSQARRDDADCKDSTGRRC